MILVGELEYTNTMMAPADTGFLFIGNQELKNGTGYVYSISPYKESYEVGDMTIFEKPLSVTEFLQYVVNSDISISLTASIKFKDDVGIRIKGMNNWITREKLKS